MVVGVAESRPVRMSRDVRSGRSSRPRHHMVLYFPHRRLWIMECSSKVLCKPCRRRLTLRLHSKPSWRLRVRRGIINAMVACIAFSAPPL
ncbi:hypothetical protein Taro_023871 [Colocasia esculenta]|uniref:Uncharacterized protein n=1 Tax=Colocasia esculenta TaxID=4460 RepID=A0A843VCQ6_COLES|nr:hypothetical protein [Colocasia esculenta]